MYKYSVYDDYTPDCPQNCPGSKEVIEDNPSVTTALCFSCDKLIEFRKYNESYAYYPWGGGNEPLENFPDFNPDGC